MTVTETHKQMSSIGESPATKIKSTRNGYEFTISKVLPVEASEMNFDEFGRATVGQCMKVTLE
jgi:hypothetical protein